MVHRKGVRIVMWTSDTVFQLPLDAQESCVAVQLTGTLSAASVVFTLVRGMLRPGARGPGRVSVSLSLRLRCRTTSGRPARWPAWRRHTASSPLTCRSAHAENRLDRPACRGVRRGLVDLVEVVKGEIGRASCRERDESWTGAVRWKRQWSKTNTQGEARDRIARPR